ncbi:MAG: hypothetical protein M3Q33_05110 [Acidobacteriota bacterium]|nr:hypothetical protein [Acidobacteriota bacterium]
MAKFYLEKTRENLESLENHGDKRRFIIYDEISGKKRQISFFDLERRAEKRANRSIKNLNVTNAVKRDEIKKTLVETELQKNSGGIKRIKSILHNLVVKENQTLRTREKNYDKINPLAEKIRAKYKGENKKLPIPNLTSEELEMLQASSIEKKNIRAANYFEKVRKELSLERGIPTRTNKEIALLKAKQILSELKIKSNERQLKDFSYGKRVFPVEIDGKKWTLAKVDSLIEKRFSDERKFVGKISKVLGKIGLVEQKDSLTKFEETKTVINEKLSERNEQLMSELKGEKSILKTLDGFYKNDTNTEKEVLGAKFGAAELAEIESYAFDLKLSDNYRENWEQQKQFIESADRKNKNGADSMGVSKEKLIAGRSIAREIISEIEVARLKEEHSFFKKNKNFQKFEITDKKTGEAKFVSLAEVRFDSRGSLFDQTLEYFLETSEKRRTRNGLELIVKEKGVELKENLKAANNLLKVAYDFASDFKTKSFFGTVKYLHAPVFTPKELMTIELRINQTENKSEVTKLQKILDSAEHSKAKNLTAILTSFSAENEQFKAIEQSSITEQKLTVSVVKDETKSEVKDALIRENRTEKLEQDRGR